MLTTLLELAEFTERLGQSVPDSVRDRVVIRRPGCTPAEVAQLKAALPGLPESYASIIAAFDLRDVEIQYFELSINSPRSLGFVERFIDRNDADNFPEMLRLAREGVYWVASFEADPICVAHKDADFRRGNIIWHQHDSPDSKGMLLADDFEEFLLILGNLCQISQRHDLDTEATAAAEAFDQYLRLLHTEQQVMDAWKVVASIVGLGR